MAWHEAPKGTQSFALIMHDPDTSKGDVTHWLLWDIGASEQSLAEDSAKRPTGANGANEHGKIAYLPPTPPRGDPPHRYIFELFALDVSKLGLKRGAKRDELEAAIEPHVLETARLVGRFGRE
ncbi:MAG: hypothetical protein JWM32_2855 [Verrucomicrobia bacterium]|nr:hypothetical protein [Verrucomicrobiota bacterium]